MDRCHRSNRLAICSCSGILNEKQGKYTVRQCISVKSSILNINGSPKEVQVSNKTKIYKT